MSKLNIGVIGVGHWGKNYIRLLNEHPEINNIYIYDISEKNIRSIIEKYPKVIASTNIDEFFKNSIIDAIIIATPATTHYSLGVMGLKNKKHLLIEKPLCTTVKEGEKLIELAEKNKCIVMVGHTFLYNNSVIQMKSIIKRKSFGKILYITARRTHLGLIRPDVSVHWDLASHDISIINYLLDKTPEYVDCDAIKILSADKYDIAHISLYYPDNILAHITVSWLDANKCREVAVIGEYAKVIFNDLSTEEPLKIYQKGVTLLKDQQYEGFGEFKYLVRDGKIESPRIKMVEPLKNQVNDFLGAISKNKQTLVTARVGLEVVKVLEKIDLAIKLKNKRKRLEIV